MALNEMIHNEIDRCSLEFVHIGQVPRHVLIIIYNHSERELGQSSYLNFCFFLFVVVVESLLSMMF